MAVDDEKETQPEEGEKFWNTVIRTDPYEDQYNPHLTVGEFYRAKRDAEKEHKPPTDVLRRERLL